MTRHFLFVFVCMEFVLECKISEISTKRERQTDRDKKEEKINNLRKQERRKKERKGKKERNI